MESTDYPGESPDVQASQHAKSGQHAKATPAPTAPCVGQQTGDIHRIEQHPRWIGHGAVDYYGTSHAVEPASDL